MNKRVSSKDYWILLTDGTNAFDSGVRAGVMQIAREIGISRIRLVNEATLENIALSLGIGAPIGGKIEFGDKTDNMVKTLFINVKGANNSSRKYTFWRCRPTGKTGQTYKRDGETLIEAEFDVLPDMSKDRGKRFGMIEDL